MHFQKENSVKDLSTSCSQSHHPSEKCTGTWFYLEPETNILACMSEWAYMHGLSIDPKKVN